LNKEIPPFVMTRGSSKAIELLNENIYNKIFQESQDSNDEVKMIYRIFFQLLNKNDISGIKNNNEFWSAAKKYFVTEGVGKTGI
jgi:hypothetical protein